MIHILIRIFFIGKRGALTVIYLGKKALNKKKLRTAVVHISFTHANMPNTTKIDK